MSEQSMVTVSLDGRQVQAPAGTYALELARQLGVEIPTLCHHPDLEPVGACRLCMVEVTHPDWGGWSGLMTACLYPVSDGLQISTRSEKVLSARRRLLSLLAARCPGSAEIQQLALEYGADTERLLVNPQSDDCILCGLCTRICESYSTAAITTCGRGVGKRVDSFFGDPPADCVGCAACALICPTGHLSGRRAEGQYQIWARQFPLALCSVRHNLCIGCGACEEACPFDVPRVMMLRGGAQVAVIPPQHCRGCGVCVGACPTGAVFSTQSAARAEHQQPPVAVVFACSRAGLTTESVGPDTELVQFDCTGRVTVPMLLRQLASGVRGVLVLGRHQQICRLGGAEDPARLRVSEAERLACLAGLGAGRVCFEIPAPGPRGPQTTVQRFVGRVRKLAQIHAREGAAVEPADVGLDSLLMLAARLGSGAPDGERWRDEHQLPAQQDGGPNLLCGLLPWLSLVDQRLWRPLQPTAVLALALELLTRELGAPVGLQLTIPGPDGDPTDGEGDLFCLDPVQARRLAEAGRQVTLVDEWLSHQHSGQPGVKLKVACFSSPQATRLIEALGHEPLELGDDPLPSRFCMSPRDRMAAELTLQQARQGGARALLVPSPLALARWALICRHGTWRASTVGPVLGVQLSAPQFGVNP